MKNDKELREFLVWLKNEPEFKIDDIEEILQDYGIYKDSFNSELKESENIIANEVEEKSCKHIFYKQYNCGMHNDCGECAYWR